MASPRSLKQSHDRLSEITNDATAHILMCLDLPSLASTAQVSKKLHEKFEDPLVWQKIADLSNITYSDEPKAAVKDAHPPVERWKKHGMNFWLQRIDLAAFISVVIHNLDPSPDSALPESVYRQRLFTHLSIYTGQAALAFKDLQNNCEWFYNNYLKF